MSTRWDALAKASILFLILSLPMVLLVYNDSRIDTSTSSSKSSLDIRTASDLGETSLQINQRNAGIAITFNGWSVDNWYDIRNLLNTYEAKVTFFVGNFETLTNNSFEKLRSLKSDGHEIAAQGFQYRNAVDYVDDYSLQAYIDNEVVPAIELLSENGLDASSFAYPYGSRNSLIDAELLKYFVRLRATTYTTNTTRIIDLDSAYFRWQNEELIRGVGIDIEYENTVEEIMEGMERANRNNEVLVLYTHSITYGASTSGTPEEKLISILEAAQTLDLGFYTVSGLSPATTSTLPIENGGTNSTWSLDDFIISIIISCVGIGLLWIFVSVIFQDGRKWKS